LHFVANGIHCEHSLIFKQSRTQCDGQLQNAARFDSVNKLNMCVIFVF